MSGSRRVRSHAIDLVHQNYEGIGTRGEPLPAGMYELEALVTRREPYGDAEIPQAGTGFAASLPFQIEP